MAELALQAKLREQTGRNATGRYRKEGFIPANLYGQGKNTNLLINNREFIKIYPKLTKSTILTLKLDKDSINVLIKDYEKNYLRGEFVHVDFFELDPKKPVNVFIPIVFIGTAVGIREGGLLEKHLTAIEVSCLPKDIMHHIEVNVENLKINESLHIRDIKLSENIKVISHGDEVIVKISTSQKEEAPEATATAAATSAPAEEKKA